MANEEHLSILKQGVKAWNKWRSEHSEVMPGFSYVDLNDANLNDANLSHADLSHADLTGANLSHADLTGANLTGVNLYNANLSHADLIRANLTRTNLNDANLSYADLSLANLDSADLSYADFSLANLYDTNLSNASLGGCHFADVDLSKVKGLESVVHGGPSYIDIHTIYQSQGNIPEAFLRGAGVPDNFITYMKSLTSAAFDFYSCFISYSTKDQAFTERLYADLQAKGVRCWYAPEDLKIGEPFMLGIDRGIRLHDKLLIVLSEHSVASQWVEHEVLSAMGKAPGCLFPIRLDDAVMNTPVNWASMIRQKTHIGDFSHWKDHEAYQKAFERLLRDLKAEG